MPEELTHSCIASASEVLRVTEGLLDPRSLMSPGELARQAALARQPDRDDFSAARVLARIVLARHFQVSEDVQSLREWGIRQRCESCGGPHGRPEIEGMPWTGLSWAHAHGWVAVAVGRGPVGVDIERFSDSSPARLRVALAWTRAEALIKFGHGNLDKAGSWALSAGPAPQGRRYRLPASGAPRASRLRLMARGDTAVLTDVLVPGVICTIAASTPARSMELRDSALHAS